MKLQSKFTHHETFIGLGLLLGVGAIGGAAFAHAQQQDTLGHQDTPLQANGKWHVHDGLRPQPPVIDPGTASTQEMAGKPPSDATVLFDGADLSHWTDGGKPAAWKVENGYMEITPKTGSLVSKEELGDCQLHVEWSAPTVVKGNGQGRGNSGILFFNGTYEVQVLDSYNNPTYPDGQAAAIYNSYPPMANAMRKPGEWNVYDIMFEVPHFENGKLVKPGYFTVMHNGVCVQNHVELLGQSYHQKRAEYHPHPPTGPLQLQNHGNPVRYRNIWFRPLHPTAEPGDHATL